MSIQSTLNQGLSIAALLTTQSPGFKAKQEARIQTRNLAQQEKAINKQLEALPAGDLEKREQLRGDLTEIKDKQFRLNPTKETYEAYSEMRGGQTQVAKEDPLNVAQELFEDEQRQQEINSYLDQMRAAAKKSTDHLIAEQERLKNTPTSLGVTIGELSPKTQAYIQKQLKEGV